jgi:hypothetical protein
MQLVSRQTDSLVVDKWQSVNYTLFNSDPVCRVMNCPRLLFLLLPLACSAGTIQGTVQNGTTGKPEPNHQVTLFTTSGEQGRTTTNENGAFRIELGAGLAPRSLAILKVLHDGVEYFQAVSSAQVTDIRVYDSSSRVSGITGYLSILQFQVKGKLLQITELHALNNASNPPVTRVDPDNLVLSIPEGAQMEPTTVSAPDGGTLKLALVPIPGHSGKYRIDLPLKPGLTKYAVSYEMPYTGQLVFRRQAQYPMQRIGVIVPESMHFRSLGARVFHAVVDQPGTHEEVLDGLNANEAFAFELSGTGALASSFHRLSPGEPSRTTGAKTVMSAPLPHGGFSGTVASPKEARTGLVGRQLNLAIGILVLVGILLCGMMLRRSSRR